MLARAFRLVCSAALMATLVGPGDAAAQSTPVTELWRERAVIERQWRAEKAALRTDRRRWRARARARLERNGTQPR